MCLPHCYIIHEILITDETNHDDHKTPTEIFTTNRAFDGPLYDLSPDFIPDTRRGWERDLGSDWRTINYFNILLPDSP